VAVRKARHGGASQHVLELTPEALADHLVELGEPRYRARQILEWVFRHGAVDFSAMTSLPVALRERLAQDLLVRTAEVASRSESADGTFKLLLRWRDGEATECVMIPASGKSSRRTVCLSTQVGCDVGCRFCASGLDAARRNLSPGEIVEQALTVEDVLRERGENLSHVVFMGMGEPLANYRATVAAVRMINAPWGLDIAQRRITISTVGLPRQIVRLAGEGLQVTLALSLHAARAPLRSRLIPWAERLELTEILEACRTYLAKTGRRVTLEYCLLRGVNDRGEDLEALARISRDLRAHVNLMLYNPVEALPFERPELEEASMFLERLRHRDVRATLRTSRGVENDAACGQLRRRYVADRDGGAADTPDATF
jgi:23S rRNA (adenine2503-C2)-methyltransferase